MTVSNFMPIYEMITATDGVSTVLQTSIRLKISKCYSAMSNHLSQTQDKTQNEKPSQFQKCLPQVLPPPMKLQINK